jgi:hypothetical protein
MRLLQFYPGLKVGDNVGGHLTSVLLDPEEAALFIGLHTGQKFFGQLFVVKVLAVIFVYLVRFAFMYPGYVKVSPILAEMN